MVSKYRRVTFFSQSVFRMRDAGSIGLTNRKLSYCDGPSHVRRINLCDFLLGAILIEVLCGIFSRKHFVSYLHTFKPELTDRSY